jgi:hypothetical protein
VNVAIADAVNLGWKLAATVQERAPPRLLETYHAERHGAGERLLRMTMAQAALARRDPRIEALGQVFAEVAAVPAAHRRLAEMVTGLDARYEMGAGGHPWVGRMAPNLRLETDRGPSTLAALMRGGRGVLLDLTGDVAGTATRWVRRLSTQAARCTDEPDLAALLVRPDGHVAWAEQRRDEPASLDAALAEMVRLRLT